MNIIQGLKLKNRLAGELSKTQTIAMRENSRRNDNPSEIKVDQVFTKIDMLQRKLINLKAAISEASAPIAIKLAELGELKQYINWIQCLPTRKGEEVVYHAQDALPYKWTAYYSQEDVDGLVLGTQKKIDFLQDVIDEYNAKTPINFTDA